MKNKLFSLTDMIKLCNDSELSEPYIRYLCGIEPDHQYKHQEIIDVSILLNNKELALFITCLRDLHNYRETYSFPNVKVIYEPNKTEALKRAKKL